MASDTNLATYLLLCGWKATCGKFHSISILVYIFTRTFVSAFGFVHYESLLARLWNFKTINHSAERLYSPLSRNYRTYPDCIFNYNDIWLFLNILIYFHLLPRRGDSDVQVLSVSRSNLMHFWYWIAGPTSKKSETATHVLQPPSMLYGG